MDSVLDTSWIEEQERLQSINENYFREPMESIHMFFIYINKNMYIDKIISEKQPLILSDDAKFSILPKETLLKIIQTKKNISTLSKYKLLDIFSYIIDLEPENIQSYSKNENLEGSPNPFFKNTSPLNDIHIEPSIFIFHNINSIFFFFQESDINNRHTLKSILKPSTNFEKVKNKNSTKKVQIHLDSNNGFKKTRKARIVVS